MADTVEEQIALLDRLIADAEGHRVDQMLRIADLQADDRATNDAEQALRMIEGLLASMRARRTVLLAHEPQF